MKFVKKILATRFAQWLVARLGWAYMHGIFHTNRWVYNNFDYLIKSIASDRPVIIVFWHGRMLMLPCSMQWKDSKLYMMISSHRDGRLISKVLSFFNIETAFGSTNRHGFRAGVEVLNILRHKKGVVGITPDGPRGPIHQVSIGTATLANLAGALILPVSYRTSRGKFLRSWDQFFLPFPFGHGVFVVGKAIDAALINDRLELIETIKNSLVETTDLADHLVFNHNKE